MLRHGGNHEEMAGLHDPAVFFHRRRKKTAGLILKKGKREG